ncbi:MAG: aminodeoxychorismate synthase component I [Saprospiraceae bacterium]|nr:aminodeoxychorismate synthase component I [Saprospiraceae bacterium]
MQAISVMNELGKKGQAFVFLIDYEMKKIIISTSLENNTSLKFDMNGYTNHSKETSSQSVSFFEAYPIDKSHYNEKFQLVKSEIQRGNSFLLNLSSATKVITDISLENLYHSADAKYKVFLKDQFVCYSPEIFVQIRDGKISSYPMKGTIDANLPNAEQSILENKKELAEHYTIVDLIRNDLSQIASQVNVDRFRYIDKISTTSKDLLQVSSEVSGKLPDDYTSHLGTLFFKLLPAGSISGAPKCKTVEIIQNAEAQPRGYYTGICGYFDGKNLDSGVMIRYVEQIENEFFYRSGGGITSMSTVEDEYQEMLDKVYLPITVNSSPNPSLQYTEQDEIN